MNDLINVGKVVGILIALIAFRFIVQAVMKKSNVRKLAGSILPFLLPPLITGGPMFIAIPAILYPMENSNVSSYLAVMAFAGGAGLSIGLGAIFIIVQRQGEEISRLEKLVTRENSNPDADDDK